MIAQTYHLYNESYKLTMNTYYILFQKVLKNSVKKILENIVKAVHKLRNKTAKMTKRTFNN